MAYTNAEWSKLTKEERRKAGFSNAPAEVKAKGILVLAIPIVFVIFLVKSCSSSSPDKQLSHQEQILKTASFHVYEVEQAVKTKLNYPLTAEFPGYPKCRPSANDSNEVFCDGKVRSKNAFGVPSELTYEVTMKVDGENVTPVSVDLFK